MPDATAPVTLTEQQFSKIRTLVYQTSGIDLKHGKEELVKARLGKELRKQNITSFDRYVEQVINDKTGESLINLINALSTNFTHFFREQKHFDYLARTIAPRWQGRQRIDVWCAAAATGEEPYSLAITLLEALGAKTGLHILASDISTRALAAADAGIYPEARLDEIQVPLKTKYFLRGMWKSEPAYRVKPEVRQLMEFRRINLIEPFSHPRQFQAIFCRNVMIYFDKPTQEKVVQRLSEWLEPGGYLFVGHAESLNGARHSLEFVIPAVYRKPGAETRRR